MEKVCQGNFLETIKGGALWLEEGFLTRCMWSNFLPQWERLSVNPQLHAVAVAVSCLSCLASLETLCESEAH